MCIQITIQFMAPYFKDLQIKWQEQHSTNNPIVKNLTISVLKKLCHVLSPFLLVRKFYIRTPRVRYYYSPVLNNLSQRSFVNCDHVV